ncbi:hypothetical protein EW026_g233 [Hermanssonia centrifuga]|uniref:NmrA-like domain-containing protein n=1 Tax=Hermanssonia centrifuga TaxID=98765 RepID=A0A4S4KVT7_9APHY|nr:hypothetical protein EW026_g233 [Hermanssonia centrifuga]
MVKVAVAGGTGGLGRYIVEAILATGKHKVVILSRSAKAPISGAEVIAVDYTDPTSLDHALVGVHTVIVCLFDHDPASFIASQTALLDAAVRSGAKRFAPSEFVIRSLANDPIAIYAPKDVVAEAVKKSGLEYTFFENGVFLNYLGTGTPGLGYMRPLHFIVNLEEWSAKLPEDGKAKIVFTHGEDVGAFVAASLDLQKWPEVSRMAGDVKSYKEIVELLETITADTKKQLVPNPPSVFTNFLGQILIEIVESGRFHFSDPNLNKLCPEVKPTNVEEFLQKWWGKNE